eukprot:SAG31_NODE_73_length_27793_cov_26.900520_18_plen_2204_part_00
MLANCTEPPPGSFVAAPCVPGNHSSAAQDAGQNTSIVACNASVPVGHYVRVGCRAGSMEEAGADTVFAPCAQPTEASYVAQVCNQGNPAVWPMIAGVNTVVARCTEVVPSSIAFMASATCSGEQCTDTECCTVPPTCSRSQYSSDEVCANATAVETPGHLVLFNPNGLCSGATCLYEECCRAPQMCEESQHSSDAACGAVEGNPRTLYNASGQCAGLSCTVAECCAAPGSCPDTSFTSDAGCQEGGDPLLELYNEEAGNCAGVTCQQRDCCVAIQTCAQSNFSTSEGCANGPDPLLSVANDGGICTGASCTQAQCCLTPQSCNESVYATDAQCAAGSSTLVLRNDSGLCVGLSCLIHECCRGPQLCADSSFGRDSLCATGPDSLLSVFDSNGTCSGVNCTQNECCDSPTGQPCRESAFANDAGCAAGSATDLSSANPAGKCRSSPCTQEECCMLPQQCSASQFDSDYACASASTPLTLLSDPDHYCAGSICLQSECCTVPQLCSESNFTTDAGCAAAAAAEHGSVSLVLTRLGITTTSCAGIACSQSECCQPAQLCAQSLSYNSDATCYANSVNRSLLAHKGGTCAGWQCTDADAATCCGVPMLCEDSVWTTDCRAGSNPSLSVFATNYAHGRNSCAGINCTQAECCAPAQTCSSSQFANEQMCVSNGAPNMTIWINGLCSGLSCTADECCATPQQCADSSYAFPDDNPSCGGARSIYNASGVCAGLLCTADECCVAPQHCDDSAFATSAACADGPQPLLSERDPTGHCASATCSQDECCYNPDAQLCNESVYRTSLGCAVNGTNPLLTLVQPDGTCINSTCVQEECCQAQDQCSESIFSAEVCANTSRILFNESTRCAGAVCEMEECCRPSGACNASLFNNNSACAAAASHQDSSTAETNTGSWSFSFSWASDSWEEASIAGTASAYIYMERLRAFNFNGQCANESCTMTECCTEPQNCSSSVFNVASADPRRRGCGAGFFITETASDLIDFQCAGQTCTYDECCVTPETCAESAFNSTSACKHYAMAEADADQSLSAFNRSGICVALCPEPECQRCNQTDCCAMPQTCDASQYSTDAGCIAASMATDGISELRARNVSGICAGTVCSQIECCQRPQLCANSIFSSSSSDAHAVCGVAGQNSNRTSFVIDGECASALCTLEECCVAPQLCSVAFPANADCAAAALVNGNNSLTVRDPVGLCRSPNCTQDECCDDPEAEICLTDPDAADPGEIVWTDPVCQHSITGIANQYAIANHVGKCAGECGAQHCCHIRQNCTTLFSKVGPDACLLLGSIGHTAMAPFGCTRSGCSAQSQATAAAGGYCRGAECELTECCALPQRCADSLYSSDFMCNLTNSSRPYYNETAVCAGIDCTAEECCNAPKSCSASQFASGGCVTEYARRMETVVRVISQCVAGGWNTPGVDLRYIEEYPRLPGVQIDNWQDCSGSDGLFDTVMARGGVCVGIDSNESVLPMTWVCPDECALTLGMLSSHCAVTMQKVAEGDAARNGTGDVSSSEAAVVASTCADRMARSFSSAEDMLSTGLPTVSLRLSVVTAGDPHHDFSPGYLINELLKETGEAVWLETGRDVLLSYPSSGLVPNEAELGAIPHVIFPGEIDGDDVMKLTQLTLLLAAQNPQALNASVVASVTNVLAPSTGHIPYPIYQPAATQTGNRPVPGLVAFAISEQTVLCATSGIEFAFEPCTAIPEGSTCEFDCETGYLPTGQHVCHPNGTMLGGRCEPQIVDAPVVSTTMAINGAAVSRSQLQAALIEQYGPKAQVLNFRQKARMSLALPLAVTLFSNVSSPLGRAIEYSVRSSAARAACPTPCPKPVPVDSVVIESFAHKMGIGGSNGRRQLQDNLNGTEVDLLIEHTEDVSTALSSTGDDGFLASFASVFNAVGDDDLPPQVAAALPSGWQNLIPIVHVANLSVTSPPTFNQTFDVALIAEESMTTTCGAAGNLRRLGEHVLDTFFCPECLAQDSFLLSSAADRATREAIQLVSAPHDESITCADELVSQLMSPSNMAALFQAAGVRSDAGEPFGECAAGQTPSNSACFERTSTPAVQCGQHLAHPKATAPCPVGLLGSVCNYSCSAGYVPAGTHVCQASASDDVPMYAGGSCIQAVAQQTTSRVDVSSELASEQAWAIGLGSSGFVLIILAIFAAKVLRKKRSSKSIHVQQTKAADESVQKLDEILPGQGAGVEVAKGE